MLERQAKSGSSGSAESTSPESSSDQSGSDAHAGPLNAGVSLPDFQNDAIYLDPIGLATSSEADLGMSAFFDPTSLDNDGFDFSNDLISDAHQSYGLYQPQLQPSLSMDQAMDIPILKTFQAGALMAKHLGCSHLLWDPTSRWTITTPNIPGLPDNMQPTPAQMSIPHHPLFDILPWPQLRTKLICVFALPEQQRPKGAQDADALLRVAYDIEDATDGFRINGEGMNRDDWEVGEAFFKNWWWALDRSIVETSNAWRQKRGQSRLSICAA